MMTIYIGADHRGYHLAETLERMLEREGYRVYNLSSPAYNPDDDYVDYAVAVGEKIASSADSRGIVICGSGIGISIAANKVAGVRCALGFTPKQIKAGRSDDDVNVLALASDFVDAVEAKELVNVFLNAKFTGEARHNRRIEKVKELE